VIPPARLNDGSRDPVPENMPVQGAVVPQPLAGMGVMASEPSSGRSQGREPSCTGFDTFEGLSYSEDLAPDLAPNPVTQSSSHSHKDVHKTDPRPCRRLGSQKITFFSSTLDTPLRATSLEDLDVETQNIEDFLASPQATDTVWWLDVEKPSARTLWTLCNTLRVHPLTAEDIWNQEQRDKFEDFSSYSFVCVQSIHVLDPKKPTSFEPYTIYVILLPRGTLSFRFTEGEHVTQVLNRIELLREHVTINSDWICYALM
jgi:hypothetical protein